MAPRVALGSAPSRASLPGPRSAPAPGTALRRVLSAAAVPALGQLPLAPVAAALLALACVLPWRTVAAQEPGTLAEGLIALRGEVEQINGELELLRDEQRTTLAGLAARRAELQADIDRHRLAARALRGQLDQQQQQAAAAGVAGAQLAPLLQQVAERLQAHIAAGLPFKTEQRIAEVASLRARLASGALPPERAVNALWALFEDEFRLSRDNSLHSQTIVLAEAANQRTGGDGARHAGAAQGTRVLADVAKIGTMALYFRTSDGRFGQALRSNGSWHFATFQEASDQARAEALFDALGKQIRQGFFELPMLAAREPQ